MEQRRASQTFFFKWCKSLSYIALKQAGFYVLFCHLSMKNYLIDVGHGQLPKEPNKCSSLVLGFFQATQVLGTFIWTLGAAVRFLESCPHSATFGNLFCRATHPCLAKGKCWTIPPKLQDCSTIPDFGVHHSLWTGSDLFPIAIGHTHCYWTWIWARLNHDNVAIAFNGVELTIFKVRMIMSSDHLQGTGQRISQWPFLPIKLVTSGWARAGTLGKSIQMGCSHILKARHQNLTKL